MAALSLLSSLPQVPAAFPAAISAGLWLLSTVGELAGGVVGSSAPGAERKGSEPVLGGAEVNLGSGLNTLSIASNFGSDRN